MRRSMEETYHRLRLDDRLLSMFVIGLAAFAITRTNCFVRAVEEFNGNRSQQSEQLTTTAWMLHGQLPLATISTNSPDTSRKVNTSTVPNSSGRHCPPKFLNVSSPFEWFLIGKPIELTCLAAGNPRPSYTWKKDNVELTSFVGEVRQTPDGGSTLLIASPHSQHEGSYQCLASNALGTAVNVKTVLRKAFLDPFSTVRQPRIHRPVIGSPLMLKCRPPKSYPRGLVFWGVDGYGLQQVDTSARVSLDYSGNLYFANVISEDARGDSTYMCVIMNTELRSLSQGDDQKIQPIKHSGVVRHEVPRLMWSTPERDLALRGSVKRIKCIFSGYPTPRVVWTRLGNPLPTRASMPPDEFGQELVIEDVQTEDAGHYQCSASNSVGNPVAKVINLIVESPPYWRHKPTDLLVSATDNARFLCSADGLPAPAVTWFINGRPIQEYPADKRRVVAAQSVEFLDVTPEDSHVLQCNVSNKHGFLFANAFLNVLAEAPTFVNKSPSLIKAAEGYSAVLECSVFGAPRPSITWSRGNHTLDAISSEDSRFNVTEAGILQIQNVTFGDEGYYRCEASNKFGNIDFITRLVIRNRTRILKPPISRTVNVSMTVSFLCLADTDRRERSTLALGWYKDGQPISKNRDFRFRVGSDETGAEGSSEEKVSTVSDELGGEFMVGGSTSLTIREAQVHDTGSYSCRAYNKIDSAVTSARLVVKDRPSPPTTVTVSHCSTTSTTVTWGASPDNNDPVLEYLVEFSSSSSGSSTQPAETRVFRSAAKLSVSGPTSTTATMIPPPQHTVSITQVYDSDHDLKSTTSISSFSSRLHPVSTSSSMIVIVGGGGESVASSRPRDTRPRDVYSVDVPLIPWTNYSFRVAGRNRLGVGPFSRPTESESCSTPSVRPYRNPTDVCANLTAFKGQLGITWQPLHDDERNGPGFHYLVSYQRLLQVNAAELKQVIRDVRQGSLTVNLSEGFRAYIIYIQAVNDEGFAPTDRLEKVIGFSGEGTPKTRPNNFQLDAELVNTKTATFSWDSVDEDDPFAMRGIFRGYQMEFWKADNPKAMYREDIIKTNRTWMLLCLRTENGEDNEDNDDTDADDDHVGDGDDAEVEYDDHDVDSKSFSRSRKRRRQLDWDDHEPSVESKASPKSEPLREHGYTTRLWPYTRVRAAVRVLNGRLGGPLSNVIEFQTPEGVPGPIASLKCSEQGPFHLKIEWSEPDEANGIITEYLVGFGIGMDGDDHGGDTKIVREQKTSKKLHQLIPNTHYIVSIYASTSAGPGPSRTIVTKTTPLAPPDPPVVTDSYITVEGLTVVSWLPFNVSLRDQALRPLIAGSEFFVDYWEIDGNETKRTGIEKDNNWVTVTGLMAGRSYWFQVTARNALGNEAASEPSLFMLMLRTDPVTTLPTITTPGSEGHGSTTSMAEEGQDDISGSRSSSSRIFLHPNRTWRPPHEHIRRPGLPFGTVVFQELCSILLMLATLVCLISNTISSFIV